ncbi:MAG: ISNCY family transposase, partial [Bacteroidetes bacterium]|nr:ISNCY family transposase [Bacteroidota bacterium]
SFRKIESNINSLEHHGLNRCPDKGIRNFKKYTALGILSYNLHILGKLLIDKSRRKDYKKAA